MSLKRKERGPSDVVHKKACKENEFKVVGGVKEDDTKVNKKDSSLTKTVATEGTGDHSRPTSPTAPASQGKEDKGDSDDEDNKLLLPRPVDQTFNYFVHRYKGHALLVVGDAPPHTYVHGSGPKDWTSSVWDDDTFPKAKFLPFSTKGPAAVVMTLGTGPYASHLGFEDPEGLRQNASGRLCHVVKPYPHGVMEFGDIEDWRVWFKGNATELMQCVLDRFQYPATEETKESMLLSFGEGVPSPVGGMFENPKGIVMVQDNSGKDDEPDQDTVEFFFRAMYRYHLPVGKICTFSAWNEHLGTLFSGPADEKDRADDDDPDMTLIHFIQQTKCKRGDVKENVHDFDYVTDPKFDKVRGEPWKEENVYSDDDKEDKEDSDKEEDDE